MAREMDLMDRSQFQFQRNWFRNRNLKTFREYIYPQFADKPTTYVEVGVFEGQSLCWMLQRVLTNPGSRAVGIDPWLMTLKLSCEFMEGVMQRAHHNASQWIESGKCQLVRGSSVDVLQLMMRSKNGYAGINRRSVDLLMIDGSHSDYSVLNDAKFASQLVKPGGWLLFDDVENRTAKRDHVKQGLDMFMENYPERGKEIWRHNFMVCLEIQDFPYIPEGEKG